MKHYPLRELQCQLSRALTHPESVHLWLNSEDGKVWASAIQTAPPLPREDRLEIYRYAYFARIHEYFEEDFARLFRVMGREPFREMVEEYLGVYPSRYTSMSDIGRDLPRFIDDKRPAREWLSGIAQLDWLANEIFWADNLPPFDRATLAGIAPEEWPMASLRFDASVRLFESSWPLDQAWEIKDESVALPSFENWEKGSYLFLMYRNEWTNYLARLSPEKYWTMRYLKEAVALGAVGDRVHEHLALNAETSTIAEEIGSWLSQWLEDGLIRDIKVGQN